MNTDPKASQIADQTPEKSLLSSKPPKPKHKVRNPKLNFAYNPNVEHIIHENEILRFSPGIQKDFVSRWVQLTSQSFRYFENQYKAQNCQINIHGPLISVPIESIKQAVKINPKTFELQQNRSRDRQEHLYQNMFELVLNCDFEQIHQYRQFDKVAHLQRIKNDMDASRSSRSMSCGKRSRESSHTKNDEYTVKKLRLGGVQRRVL